MKQYKNYFIAYAVFLVCLFTAPHVYSFFDFHVSDAYEHYELDRKEWERTHSNEFCYMSYPEWQAKDDAHSKDFFHEFSEQCALSFDPWFEPQMHLNERGDD